MGKFSMFSGRRFELICRRLSSPILPAVVAATLAVSMAGPGFAQNAPAGADVRPPPIGKVVSTVGTVTVEHQAAVVQQVNLTPGPLPAKVGDLVYRGDVIETGADSKAGITFTDGTAFNVASNARMELNEFVYNPNGRANSSLFNLAKGTFTFIAGGIAKTGDMKIETPVATMGIRGTTPRVEVAEDGSVRFSTLVEEARNGTPGANQPGRRTSTARSQAARPSQVPTGRVDEAYNGLIKMDFKLCRGC